MIPQRSARFSLSPRGLLTPLALCLALGLAMAACEEDPAPGSGSSGTGQVLCDPDAAQLIVDFDTPIAGYTWNDPHVLQEGTNYWMYASATDSFVFPVALYRMGSTDGINWTLNPGTQNAASPMFGPGGAAGTWDDGGAETPAVVYFNGNYHLFYTTYETEIDAPDHSVLEFRIGHAVSADGVGGWVVDDIPVVSPTTVFLDFNESIVAEPAPVVFGGELYLYFTAVGANLNVGTTLQVIGLVTSGDGVTWSDPESVLEPDQDIYPRQDGWYGYSTPNAVVHNDEMHLFFDVANEIGGWKQVALHHAVSADGKTGWSQDAQPLLELGDPAWTEREIRSPSALDDDGTLRLYFAGDALEVATVEGDFGIGVTSCPGVSW